ncbi:MAG: 4-(cytidine 5'-diphospho)-2-C-methyl-D-erythritol kinase [Rhodobacteraceae bacterium]|nr:4-(cytidine 5'-diphospho)-2-C-methyl-D-erythritol kinase [Paracoccaceae bacterium]
MATRARCSGKIARAKINLCLHVTGQREDGYHLLDSIVCFADCGDRLEFAPDQAVSLSIDGPFSQGLSGLDDNLILKAARCFDAPAGCAIHLQKHLPVASGIGGGSADAATALHGLAALWHLPLPGVQTQLSLGADVPVCVQGQAVRMQGVGERLQPLEGWPDLPVMLVNPGVSISTPEVFSVLKNKQNSELADMPEPGSSLQKIIAWLALNRNDLEPAAITCEPVIGTTLESLRSCGARLARMSGSGATCFGVFETLADAKTEAKKLQSQHPDWWVQPTMLRGSNLPGNNKI